MPATCTPPTHAPRVDLKCRTVARLPTPSRPWFLVLVAALALAGCQPQGSGQPGLEGPAPTAGPASPSLRGTTFTLAITGMHCDGCASGLKSELARVPGVASAAVDLKTARARVTCDTNRVTVADLLTTVEEAGFQATVVAP